MKIDREKIMSGMRRFFAGVVRLMSHNLGLKVMSVFIALFLWSYVISSSPSITREKTLTGLDIHVTGQSVLGSRNLAVLEMGDTTQAQARVRVSQSAISSVTDETVLVELDLSGVRAAGRQQVRLRASSTYGSVVQVVPESIDVVIEQRDERIVPVNVELTGDMPGDHWYSYTRTNPAQVTISGPTSVVQTVASALITPDVTGRVERYSTALPYVLLDAHENEITASLSRSTSSITVAIEVSPTRLIDVAHDMDDLLTGQVAEGYEVTAVDISPRQIAVAADQSLLDTLTELAVEPIDVTGASHSFTSVAKVLSLKGVNNLSSGEVNVTVSIGEKEISRRVRKVAIDYVGAPEGKKIKYNTKRLDVVRITGPASIVNAIDDQDVQATVNLTGLVAGDYEIPIELSVDGHPELKCIASIATVTVSVSE